MFDADNYNVRWNKSKLDAFSSLNMMQTCVDFDFFSSVSDNFGNFWTERTFQDLLDHLHNTYFLIDVIYDYFKTGIFLDFQKPGSKDSADGPKCYSSRFVFYLLLMVLISGIIYES
jgi:hypothetical protein